MFDLANIRSLVSNLSTSFFTDTVTFQRPTNSSDSVGGTTTAFANTSPANVPCIYEPLPQRRGGQRQIADKIVAGSFYNLYVPANLNGTNIDVDAKCRAVVAARADGEPSRTFKILTVDRMQGVLIVITAALEE